jgi:predicted amidohydrolase
LSKRLHAVVIAGYPERLDEADKSTTEDGIDIVGYNSCVVYGREGERIGDYRKTNLFRVDKTWAKAGECQISISMR